ncbi:MAG: hypothetical protein RLZZ387_5721 [Chloroflexota bacterium]|jgi:hypothetical protein
MALAGDLSEFPLTDIIQLVDLSKKTGAVNIKGRRGSQQADGWLYFRDGRIIGASLASLPPLEAAYAFFTFNAGPFQFYEGKQPEAPTITVSNEVIIMEGIMRQDAVAEAQEQLPSLSMIPRLVPNPAATGSEISLEADEWRVLTMVNGKNTVGYIAQRSGLGEVRTCEIVARLLGSGLIERREVSLSEALFPEVERLVLTGLGASARALLYDSYTRAGVRDQNTATADQINAALDLFESAATRAFGAARVRQPMAEMRSITEQVFSSRS